MNIAVFDIYHEFHFDILQELSKNNISVSYCITGEPENYYGNQQRINNVIGKTLKNSTIDSLKTFLFPENIMELNNIPFYLSNDLLEDYSAIEVTYLKITDRASAIPTSIHSRRKYYHTLLNFFIHVIKSHQISMALCFDTPHSPHGWIFHQVLLKNKIKVIRMEHHYFSNYCLLIANKMMPLIPDRYLKDETVHEIKNTIPKNLLAEIEEQNAFIEKSTRIEKSRLVDSNFKGKLKLFYQFAFKFLSNIAIGIFPFLYKKHLRHFTSLSSIKSEFKYRFAINKRVIDMYILWKYYSNISITPNLEQKYIYFGLHMQPEKTTLPMGRQMDHHLTSITILSQSLPKGWKLFVKEHPNQYNFRKVANANFRDKLFYNTVKKLPNTYLISQNISSSELIEKAQVVSTTTGTMGYEAILSGLPVLVFGDAYYRACRAVRTVDDVSSCKKAIEDLCHMTPDEIRKELYRYVSYYYQSKHLIEGTNWETRIDYAEDDRKTLITKMSNAISLKLNYNNCDYEVSQK